MIKINGKLKDEEIALYTKEYYIKSKKAFILGSIIALIVLGVILLSIKQYISFVICLGIIIIVDMLYFLTLNNKKKVMIRKLFKYNDNYVFLIDENGITIEVGKDVIDYKYSRLKLYYYNHFFRIEDIDLNSYIIPLNKLNSKERKEFESHFI